MRSLSRYSFGLMGLLLAAALSGCITNRYALQRKSPHNPLANQLELDSRDGPRPTPRTMQTLRQYDLVQHLDGDPDRLLELTTDVANSEPTPDNVYAIAELAYISALRAEQENRADVALDLYGMAVANAYLYLLDEKFDVTRNPYDPRFRRACDLYNLSLEAGLRQIKRRGLLKSGENYTITTERQVLEFSVATRGTWQEENFRELMFVSDFKVNELRNNYRTFGLGVPMIAVIEPQVDQRPSDQFYPPGMSFPVTVFVRVDNDNFSLTLDGKRRHKCVIELHDPISSTDLLVNNRMVPLETDITTPLAYSLDNPMFKKANFALGGLVKPDEAEQTRGLYMLEPYDPDKIPVIMVHGFWSNLVTWMEMFNDLRGSPEIRGRYQFWFYLYPTGEPFWYTAAELRAQVARARAVLDPEMQSLAMGEMVLVGHSMGGLISKLQTMESGGDFWRLVSDKPLSDLNAAPEVHELLANTFYFEPNRSVARVITIASPHRGSNFSNSATQWLGRKIINIPRGLELAQDTLLRDNPGFFHERSLLRIDTSVDALAAESPMVPVMLSGRQASWVQHHNIVGLIDDGVIERMAGEGDGVVPFASAHLDGVASEIIVKSDHMNVHRSPLAILEVKRILREHLATLDQQPKVELFGPPPPVSQRIGETNHQETPEHTAGADTDHDGGRY